MISVPSLPLHSKWLSHTPIVRLIDRSGQHIDISLTHAMETMVHIRERVAAGLKELVTDVQSSYDASASAKRVLCSDENSSDAGSVIASCSLASFTWTESTCDTDFDQKYSTVSVLSSAGPILRVLPELLSYDGRKTFVQISTEKHLCNFDLGTLKLLVSVDVPGGCLEYVRAALYPGDRLQLGATASFEVPAGMAPPLMFACRQLGMVKLQHNVCTAAARSLLLLDEDSRAMQLQACEPKEAALLNYAMWEQQCCSAAR